MTSQQPSCEGGRMRTGDVRGELPDAPLLALEVRGRANARGRLCRLEPPGNPPCSLRKPPCLPRNRYVQGLSVWSVGGVVHHCAGRREHLACLRGSSASGGSRTRGGCSQGVPQVRGHLHMGSDLSHLGLKQLLVPRSLLLLCFVSASPAGLSVLRSHCFIPSTSGQTVS